jgi:hypothetical protein
MNRLDIGWLTPESVFDIENLSIYEESENLVT